VNTNQLISVEFLNTYSVGSSLLSKFDYIDFSFHENEMLFELVDTKTKFCSCN
jgi:hypothetical protein